ncbi:SMC-Scp complex subunit ScpB [Hyphococcus lacteus]|uniref:SMC-Scp complex subunit ScpB n=1 Tax=Hyphococcus lacteus TaxID=3143536 RepID=A0ABV3Z706_9PROT
MTDSDAGRDFKGLDARATQDALAEELSSEESEVTSVDDQVSENEMATELETAPTADDVAERTAEDNEPSLNDSDEVVSEDVAADTEIDTAVETDAEDVTSDEGELQEAAAPAPVEWSEEDLVEQTRMLEALLFAAFEPLDRKSIVDRLPAGADVDALLERVRADYENRGVNLRAVEGKWHFVTSADVAHVLQKEKTTQRKLSRAALETLAIIAYHQPCTRADIEDVRGVQVAKGSLDQLLEIGWVKLRGKRRDAPGRPTLYGTTQSFLEHFGLETVTDLPGLADLKAAGLLDARLPPGFSVPSPSEAEDDEDDGEDGEDGEFAQDFLNEDEGKEIPDSIDEAADI